MVNGENTKRKRKRPGAGIVDWDEKQEILGYLFGYTNKEIVSTILDVPELHATVKNTIDAMRKWDVINPTGHIGTPFLSGLIKRLITLRPDLAGQERHVRKIILFGDKEQFLGLLPNQDQTSFTPELPKQNDSRFHRTWRPRYAQQESVLDSIKIGRIYQKSHYLMPEAEEHWRAVVNSGVYNQYEECKMALTMLCENDIWKRFFDKQGSDGAVMLGCGAGSKDSLIIQSMLSLSQSDKVHYALVDFSPYMLEAARCQVELMLTLKGLRPRVEVSTHEFDFVNDFSGVGSLLSRKDRNIAWLLPGGTIGNLNEQQLFDSIAAESNSGDLLVIGAETVDPDSTPQDNNTLAIKYRTKEVRRFVEMPFHSVLHALEISECPPIVVDVVDGHESGHSEIKGSVTVEVSSIVKGKKLVLLTSTRYKEDAFVAFATQKRFFRREAIINSPLNKYYKQFVFRRV